MFHSESDSCVSPGERPLLKCKPQCDYTREKTRLKSKLKGTGKTLSIHSWADITFPYLELRAILQSINSSENSTSNLISLSLLLIVLPLSSPSSSEEKYFKVVLSSPLLLILRHYNLMANLNNYCSLWSHFNKSGLKNILQKYCLMETKQFIVVFVDTFCSFNISVCGKYIFNGLLMYIYFFYFNADCPKQSTPKHKMERERCEGIDGKQTLDLSHQPKESVLDSSKSLSYLNFEKCYYWSVDCQFLLPPFVY